MDRQAYGTGRGTARSLVLPALVAFVISASGGLAGCKTGQGKGNSPASESGGSGSSSAGGGGTSNGSGSTGSTDTPAPVTPPTTPVPPPVSPPPPPVEPPPPVNTAPTLQGASAPIAKTSQVFSYQPEAYDADGDVLAFGISNMPEWATFDIATGRLEGTPPDSAGGTTTVVHVAVSDGKASTTLAVTIHLIGPVVGSATLTWSAPTTNADGTPLHDLAGYVIRYGRVAGSLDQSLRIGDARITSAAVENLSEGIWFFSLSAVNAAGVESDPAGYLSKTIG